MAFTESQDEFNCCGLTKATTVLAKNPKIALGVALGQPLGLLGVRIITGTGQEPTGNNRDRKLAVRIRLLKL